MTKPTRDQRISALLDMSRRARTTGGNLEASGRVREALAYEALSDALMEWARYVQTFGWASQPRLWELPSD